MAKEQVYRKKLDENGQPVIENGDFVMELVSEKNIPDEPITADWLGLEQDLYYSGLRQKAKESPNLDQFEYSSLIGAFGNGKKGLTSERTLWQLLHAINADWNEEDVATLDGLLEKHHFTIRYSTQPE